MTNIANATHGRRGMNLKRILLALFPTAQVQMLRLELLLARTARGWGDLDRSDFGKIACPIGASAAPAFQTLVA
jgi:hypothetical protein